MAVNGLYSADVPLRNCSLTHSCLRVLVMQAYLTDFLRSFSALPYYATFSQHHTDVERQVLSVVGISVWREHWQQQCDDVMVSWSFQTTFVIWDCDHLFHWLHCPQSMLAAFSLRVLTSGNVVACNLIITCVIILTIIVIITVLFFVPSVDVFLGEFKNLGV